MSELRGIAGYGVEITGFSVIKNYLGGIEENESALEVVERLLDKWNFENGTGFGHVFVQEGDNERIFVGPVLCSSNYNELNLFRVNSHDIDTLQKFINEFYIYSVPVFFTVLSDC